MNPHWIVPDWHAPAGVRALCTTRAGGVSPAPYDSMNLGGHVGDWGYNVMANRNALRRALAARPVYLSQVHGSDAVTLVADTPDGTQADACVTTQAGLACTVIVADCLPVLFASACGRVVGAAHAGWRGLAGGVLESAWHAVAAQLAGITGGTSSDTAARDAAAAAHVWLGPCIGPRAFEVGEDVLRAFVAVDPAAEAAFTPGRPGKYLADLPGLARQRLRALGLTRFDGNDGSDAWCTVADRSRFFSFRRDGPTGRMAACVWIDRGA